MNIKQLKMIVDNIAKEAPDCEVYFREAPKVLTGIGSFSLHKDSMLILNSRFFVDS